MSIDPIVSSWPPTGSHLPRKLPLPPAGTVSIPIYWPPSPPKRRAVPTPTPAATSLATAVTATGSFKSTTARIPLLRRLRRWIRPKTRIMPRAWSPACSSATAATFAKPSPPTTPALQRRRERKTRWSDGSDLAYADSVMRHYQRLTGDSPKSFADRRIERHDRIGRCASHRRAAASDNAASPAHSRRPIARGSHLSSTSDGLCRAIE